MPESLKTKLWRWGFNFFPAFRGTGAKAIYISDDFHNVKIKIPFNWRTKNYVGTIFGGSMFAATDPMYPVMLIKILGPNYIVWDKESNIRYYKPGRTTLFASAKLDKSEIDEIKDLLGTASKIDRFYQIELLDESGIVHATIDKTVHIRNKE